MKDPSLLIVGIVVWVGLYIWLAASLHAVFRKAGEEGWKAWVPVLNVVVLLQLGGFSGWFVLLGFVPIVNIALLVMLIISYHRINVAFGYGAGMTVLAALVLPVWSSILGWGSARWVGTPSSLASVGPMRRSDGDSASVRAQPPGRAVNDVSGYSPPPGYASPSTDSRAASVAVPPRPPLPILFPEAAVAFGTDAAPARVAPAWAPSIHSDEDSEPAAPRRSTAVSADELPQPIATVAQPPAYVPSPAPSPAPAAAPAPAPAPPAGETPPQSAEPLDWWAVPPEPAAAEDAPAPRRSNAVGLDPVDEDTRDVADLGRDGEDPADDDAWAAPEIAPPPAYSDGPLRSRRAAPSPDDFADEPFDTSFEVSAVAGAPTLGAPVSAMSSVSAVQTGAAIPDDGGFLVEAGLDGDEDSFDETVVAVRRRALWHLRPPLGAPIAVTSDILILGRRPAGDPDFPDAQLVPVSDETRTMSKTHARLELHGDAWVIIDLDSTNGVVLLREEGTDEEATPGIPMPVEGSFLLGDAELHLFADAAAR